MTFSEVIGQEDIKKRLMRLISEERIPHAMMLCGPVGCGKLAMALAFASHLLTERKVEAQGFFGEDNGDQQIVHDDRAEAMLKQWAHPDLHFTYPTIKPPSMGSDHQPISDDFAKEWRELLLQTQYPTFDQWLSAMNASNQQGIITGAESDELARKLSLKSSQGGYKVSIIWLPERMNATSANKLLKLLEEPPQQTVFIMVSEEPELLLETIRSRVQRIDLKKTDNDAIEKALIEKRGIDQESAHRIARIANGNWNKALEELDASNENQQFFDLFVMLMRLAYTRKIQDLKKWSENIASFGREKQKRMINYFLRMIRENFVYNFHQPELNYMTVEEENFSKNFSRFINEANVIEISDVLTLAKRDISQNANSKIVFFDMALKMIILLIQK